jgi:ribonuclease HI
VSGVEVYTDGGCSGNPGPGGWAYLILVDDRKRAASGGAESTTNNRMELQAVIAALREVGRHPEWAAQPVSVYTDSAYVQRGISQWIHTWKRNGWRTSARKPVKNRELWQELSGLSASLRVRWHWLQGHAGHTHNEECDRLVREAITKLKR